MNIGVYVSSQYGDYYEFSKKLASVIMKYTKDPVLLGVYSNTKDTGYELLRRYAEEKRIHLKTYTSEWRRRDDKRFIGKRGQSLGGVIAIYHCVHNSEKTIAFNSGGKGTAAFIKMSDRLERPCDVIQVDPFKKPRIQRNIKQKDVEKEPLGVEKTPDSEKIQRNIRPAQPVQQANRPQTAQQPTAQQQQPSQPSHQIDVEKTPDSLKIQRNIRPEQNVQQTAPSQQTQQTQQQSNSVTQTVSQQPIQNQQTVSQQPQSSNPQAQPQQTAAPATVATDHPVQRQSPSVTVDAKPSDNQEGKDANQPKDVAQSGIPSALK